MTDEYLITMLRNNVGVSEAACRAAKAAADRIEQLIAERDAAAAAAYEVAAKAVAEARVFSDDDTDGETAAKVIALGRAGKAIRALATADQQSALDRLIAEAVGPYVEALRVLIDHTHECERELTEALYHADFCGESRPLTDARAILAASKKVSKP